MQFIIAVSLQTKPRHLRKLVDRPYPSLPRTGDLIALDDVDEIMRDVGVVAWGAVLPTVHLDGLDDELRPQLIRAGYLTTG